ncbi:MAG: S9 family peptidase [Firmicutes bacterium]|nr:S9 family peptidase [Bacillota bacterium]
MGKTIAPYGSWRSPITAELIVRGSVGLAGVWIDGDDVLWLEARPWEAGRNVVVRRSADGTVEDVTPAPFNARTRVHEYGGGAVAVHEGTVYFSNFADQRLYRVRPGGAPEPVTPEGPFRYADGVVDRRRNRLICVREDHTASDRDAENTIVAVDLDTGRATVLISGADFYAAPRLSPDGRRLCWLSWNHPRMPWDGTELWVAELNADGSPGPAHLAAGGPEESIVQPEWSPDGVLHFVSDRTGWWNLYRLEEDGERALAPMEAEFGEPHWQFGQSTYAFAGPDRIVCKYEKNAFAHLATLDLRTGELRRLDLPFTVIQFVRARGRRVCFVGGAPDRPGAVVDLDLGTGAFRELRRSTDVEIDPGYVSVPEAIEFPTQGGRTAHALYYAPRNRDFEAPEGERPPLLVISHGGPTAHSRPAFNLGLQYWTSRGFAVVDVNYGGSSGYGRAYRERLKGMWGVVDVDDCVAAALNLAERGWVDRNRLAIRGGSAGGYTTMAALVFRDVFEAGASHFGVSDLETLARDTHKFESRYLDSLVGPYPERRDLYVERSPIHFIDRLSCPMIFFQGLEDRVVPPAQAETMVAKLREKGIPVAYLAFEGEGHGFRKAENIKRTLEAELYFYSKIFGFPLADEVEPVEIANLA